MLKQSKKSGFTLLELLIVVIIVSILAAVALPRFARMTRRARGAEGVTSVSALLTAESLYYQEFGSFTGTSTNLMVDVDTTNFSYGYTVAAGSANVRIVATGTAAFAGVMATGTVTDTGGRTVQSN